MSINTKLEILFSDDHIVIVNKPGGLLSVPGKGFEKLDSVSTRLKQHFPHMISQPAVHRLDIYTTGLMVYGVTKKAHRHLSIQFEKRQIKKKYIGIVERKIIRNSGEIRLAFRLDTANRPLQVYDPIQGKRGISLWRKISCSDSTSRIEFTPIMGRTHQLRVHSAHPLGLNAPIVGDSLYGSGIDGDQMMLCASTLGFHHPQSDKWLVYDLEPPF